MIYSRLLSSFFSLGHWPASSSSITLYHLSIFTPLLYLLQHPVALAPYSSLLSDSRLLFLIIDYTINLAQIKPNGPNLSSLLHHLSYLLPFLAES